MPSLQALVEGDVDLGDGGQPAVDAAVGADHLDVEAGNAELADPLDRVRDAVRRTSIASTTRATRGAARPSRPDSRARSRARNAVAGR